MSLYTDLFIIIKGHYYFENCPGRCYYFLEVMSFINKTIWDLFCTKKKTFSLTKINSCHTNYKKTHIQQTQFK